MLWLEVGAVVGVGCCSWVLLLGKRKQYGAAHLTQHATHTKQTTVTTVDVSYHAHQTHRADHIYPHRMPTTLSARTAHTMQIGLPCLTGMEAMKSS